MSVNFTPSADIDGNGNAGFEYVDPNATGAAVTYKFDASFEMIGESITYDNGDVFSETVTDNGDGTYTIAGTESTNGGNDTRSYSFVYNTSDDSFSSGTETINGNTKTYNSSWAVTSETRDTGALGTALTDAQLTGVPESLKSTQSDGETYSSVETFTGGTETTFYDSTGAILGYASTSTQTDGGNTYTSTFYSDASWEFAGNSWSDPYGSGSTSRVKKTDTNGDYVTANDPYFEEIGTRFKIFEFRPSYGS